MKWTNSFSKILGFCGVLRISQPVFDLEIWARDSSHGSDFPVFQKTGPQ